MAYQSNYPPYHGGPPSYPPQYPNSGPPPPPMPMAMNAYSAYNVNQYQAHQNYGYGQYQPMGTVPGYNMPVMQQMNHQSMHMQQMSHGPPVMPAPMTSYLKSMETNSAQHQMHMQEEMMKKLAGLIQQGEDLKEENLKALLEKDDVVPVDPDLIAQSVSDDEVARRVKEEMKNIFVMELMRRQKVSGTFELTEGTIKPFKKYEAQDPVAVWYLKNRQLDMTGKDWDAECDCEYLRDAMKNLGTDDDAVIHVVTTRCNLQRQEMKKVFKTIYGRDLIEDLKGELSGHYKVAIMSLFVPPAEYDAWCIKDAIYGLGTDDKVLIEILMTRTNDQIQEIRAAYPNIIYKDKQAKSNRFEDDIKNDTSGDFKRLLISASQGNRYEIPHKRLEESIQEIINPQTEEPTGMYEVNYTKLADMERAKVEAQQLYKAGEKRWGTDEETFNRIFASRNYYQLRATWDEYVKITQRDILNTVDRETSGNFKKGLRSMVMNIRSRPMFFAEKLRDAMKGLGTDEQTIIRIIVSRSEIDLVQIKECFLKITEQTLWRWLKHDTSFNFKKVLLGIVGKN